MIVDLFAGPGGWSEGLRSIGLSDVGLEIDAAACATRAAAGHRTIRCDVAQYPTEPFVGKVRGLIASPPCQAWSMAGKGAGRKEVDRVHAAVDLCRDGWTDEALAGPWADERTPLILQPLRWAWALKPAWIACEQVPPALGVWEHMADVLRSWGYSADARVLCAADYGVPQTRNRAYLLAHADAVRWPEPTHAEKPEPSLFGASRKPWVTMAQALGWEPGSRAWDRRVGGYAEDADAIPDTRPAPTLTSSMDNGDTKWVHNRPATTVQADPRVGRPGHKDRSGGESQFAEESVRITVGQAAVLQGFAPDYPWQGTKTKQFEQVGNVVCPPMAAALICALESATLPQQEAA